MKNIVKMSLKGVVGFTNKIKNKFSTLVDIVSLKAQLKLIQKENESLRKKERPYINKISVLTAQNRKYNLELIRARAEIERLQDTVRRYEEKYDYKNYIENMKEGV